MALETRWKKCIELGDDYGMLKSRNTFVKVCIYFYDQAVNFSIHPRTDWIKSTSNTHLCNIATFNTSTAYLILSLFTLGDLYNLVADARL